MSKSDHHKSYVLLGESLKQLRETRRESVAEVSGAIEIDMELLERFERGEECPSEDILHLLISHFDLQDHEAVRLWEWAGFNQPEDNRGETLQDLASKATLVFVTIDSRVMYTDAATIATNDKGLVLNFLQTGSQIPLAVARVGMSYQQAEEVMRSLERALLRQRYMPKRLLLPPTAS